MSERDEAAESRDPHVEALFRHASAERADENFVAATMRRVDAARAQRRFVRRFTEVGALLAIVVASPWLIAASVRLSSLVDSGLATVSGWIATPSGLALTIAIVAIVAAYRPLLKRLAPRASAPDARRRDSRDPG
jgi:hypothetical protein